MKIKAVSENLKFKNYQIKGGDGHLTESYFEEYMEYGGMPEYVLTKDPTYITELLNSIVLKDIVAKHNIRNTQLVFDVLKILMERVGKTLSYAKIGKIQGQTIDIDGKDIVLCMLQSLSMKDYPSSLFGVYL